LTLLLESVTDPKVAEYTCVELILVLGVLVELLVEDISKLVLREVEFEGPVLELESERDIELHEVLLLVELPYLVNVVEEVDTSKRQSVIS
jgi:hypothetical protein